jgi:HD-like signal output (HDOD) protein
MIALPERHEKLMTVATELPAGPRILALLGRRLLDMHSDLGAVADLIRCDPALTARIVRIANSVAFRTESPLGSLEEALARVGFVEVYRLTGFIAVAQISESSLPFYGITGAQLRENSLLTALLMEELAEEAAFNSQAAYTAGLLRSIGKIALNRIVIQAGDSANYELEGSGPLAMWEARWIGLNNCEAAAEILQEWRFPEEMTAAIGDHYAPTGRESALASLLNLAAGAAERCGHGLPGEYSYWEPTKEKFALTGLDAEKIDEATRRALEKFGPIRAAVG